MEESSKEMLKRLSKRFVYYVIAILFSLVMMYFIISQLQESAAIKKQKENCNEILTEIVSTLDENSNQVTLLTNRFHENNQLSLMMIEKLFELGKFNDIATSTDPDYPFQVMKDIQTEADVDYLLIVKDDATLVLNVDRNNFMEGASVIKSDTNPGLFTQEEFDSITKTTDGYEGSLYTDANGNKQYIPVKASYTLKGITYTNYYYSYPLYSEGQPTGYFLISMKYATELEYETSNLKNIHLLLNDIHVGTNGFAFTVDTETKRFTHYDDGTNVLTGESYENYGLSENALVDGYVGYQTINNIEYLCVAKTYESEVFGNHTVITAVIPEQEVNQSNSIITGWALIALFISGNLILTYSFILMVDQIKRGANIEERRVIHFSKKKKMYYNVGIVKKILPYMFICTFFMLGVTMFTMTLSNLSFAISTSESRMEEALNVLSKNEVTAETINSFNEDQFKSKINMLGFILEYAPEIAFTYDTMDETHYDLAKDENNNKLTDEYGNYIWTSRYAPNLVELCENYGLNNIYIYDENGHVIATSGEYWNNVLSNDPDDSSYAFRNLLINNAYYIQDANTNDTGVYEQYIGSAYYYYTYNVASKTYFASRDEFENGVYDDAGNLIISSDQITRHRGVLQFSIDASITEAVTNITSLDYILSGMYVGTDGFFVAFENDDDHTIIYSAQEQYIGKPSSSIGLTDTMFSGTYNGFQRANGEQYFVNIRYNNGIYIGTAIPTDSLQSERMRTSVLVALIGSIFIWLLCGFIVYTDDKDDEAYSVITEKYKNEEIERSTVTITLPNGETKRVKTAAARWNNDKFNWNGLTPDQKLGVIVKWAIYTIVLLILILMVLANKIFDDNSIILYIMSGDWDHTFNIFSATAGGMVLIIAVTGSSLINMLIGVITKALGTRSETLGNLLKSVIKYGGVIAAIFYTLYLFGVNTASLVTSASLLSIVIGLGAQSLISDILAGIFIVFEGEFRVGDIVTVGDFRGQVLEIGIRTTKIEDTNQDIKIYNNSDITGILNMTQESSFACTDVGISYNESIERVEAILREEFPNIREKLDMIVDGPFYLGVIELGSSAVTIRIIATCTEIDRIQLNRDLNREIFMIFQKHQIEIPFPQVTVTKANEVKKQKISIHDVLAAEEFVTTQKEASKNIKDVDVD